jgi:hypothetical protein
MVSLKSPRGRFLLREVPLYRNDFKPRVKHTSEPYKEGGRGGGYCPIRSDSLIRYQGTNASARGSVFVSRRSPAAQLLQARDIAMGRISRFSSVHHLQFIVYGEGLRIEG